MPGYHPTHRSPRPPRRIPGSGWVVGAVSVLAVIGAVVGGLALFSGEPGVGRAQRGSRRRRQHVARRARAHAASDPEVDPDEPTSWGPTVGELAAAQELVAGLGRRGDWPGR